ncbi:hypothetical protein QE389_002383 [Brevundimonas sp. SORGH_AS 993]|nr:hypothetical protein [Brevundimonas sp. SORGH_AS_0993]
MRFLEEQRRRPAVLADHLPWAALAAPGVVLNKDGSFTTGFRFHGPDLESSTEDELMAVQARLNNALRRLGTGWCLHMEARRREAAPYHESGFDLDVAWLMDAERRGRFETREPAFETDFRLALTWLPPADETRALERWLFDGLSRKGADWRTALDAFRRESDTTFDLLAAALVNESASLPKGLYVRAIGAAPQRGAVVALPQPTSVRAYLGRLGLPPEVLLIKRVAATAGERVCRVGDRLAAPGRVVRVRSRDRQGVARTAAASMRARSSSWATPPRVSTAAISGRSGRIGLRGSSGRS